MSLWVTCKMQKEKKRQLVEMCAHLWGIFVYICLYVCVKERDGLDGEGRERHSKRIIFRDKEKEWLSPEFMIKHWKDWIFFTNITGRLEVGDPGI